MSTQTQSQTYELQIGGVDDPEQPYRVQWQTIQPAQPMQDGDTAASILADWRSQSSDTEPDQAARVVVLDEDDTETGDAAEWWGIDDGAW